MEILQKNERDGLNKYPPKLAIQMQSDWLLGYADCWNKLYNKLIEKN